MNIEQIFSDCIKNAKSVPLSYHKRVIELPVNVKEAYQDYCQFLEDNKTTASIVSFESWLGTVIGFRNHQIDSYSSNLKKPLYDLHKKN